MSHIPNCLTLSRLTGSFATVWFMSDNNFGAALWTHIGCAITDFADGFIARRFHWDSRLGSFLDAFADKVYALSIFSVLTLQGRCPVWFLALAFTCALLQFTALALARVSSRRIPRVAPNRAGKVNLCLQLLWIGIVLIQSQSEFLSPRFVSAGFLALGSLQAYASALYFVQFRPKLFPPMPLGGVIEAHPRS